VRVCILADDFSPPSDEGFKKVAFHLSRELSQGHEVLAIGKRGGEAPFPLEVVRANVLFLSPGLKRRVQGFDPDWIVYIPFSSCTRNSFLRCRILKWFCPRARLGMIAVQFRFWQNWELPLVRRWQPDLVLTPLPDVLKHAGTIGIRADYLPFGVDLAKFHPSPGRSHRVALRKKFGIPAGDRVYLHVGQITEKRNLRLLSGLQGKRQQVVVVGSSSSASEGYPHDRALVRELENAGVRVWIRYFPNLEEIYQMADCYVFPVFDRTGGIGFPLSVIEALACGVPAVTTRYGGLELAIGAGSAIQYADSDEELVSLAQDRRTVAASEARALVEDLGWDKITSRVVNLLRGKDR